MLRARRILLLMAVLLVGLLVGLAFANGANDVSKGVATLVGSGVADTRRALFWGAAWTVLGAGAALLLSAGLITTFSGNGLLHSAPGAIAWPAAVAAGTMGWIGLATRLGLPVSTTHALVGSLLGAAMASGGSGAVMWSGVVARAGLPLLLSPFLSLMLVSAVLPVAGGMFRRLHGYCVCLERRELAFATVPFTGNPFPGRHLQVRTGTDCPPRLLARVSALDSLHWLTAGLTSFTRGLNDAPKIVALGLAAGSVVGVSLPGLLALVAAGMGAGSWYAGRRVTGTLATGITPMSASEGLTANTVTAGLVGFASAFGWPVSTTHVSAGTIIGVGLHRRQARWTLIREMLLAWLVTLPAAGLLAGAVYLLVIQ